MAFSKIILNNSVLIDLTQDTVQVADVFSPKTFHKADGTQGTGTATQVPDGNNMSFGYTDATLPYVGIAKVGQAVI